MLRLRLGLIIGLFLWLALGTTGLHAQSAIDAITFTWVDVNNSTNDYTTTSPSNAGQSIDANTTYDVRFASTTTTENNRVVNSFTVNGTTYSFLLDPDTLALRRVGSASRLSLWMEAESIDNTNDILTLNPERQVPERSLYQASLLNIGYDNVLVNSGTNSSNIERIDAIYGTGMLTATPANALIPVLDRGANAVFKIAAILSLDANGEPASYGSLVEVEAGDSGGQVLAIGSSVLFLQQALGEDPIPTGSSTQGVGGVAISLQELGVAANQVIYGYSLFSIDVNDIDHDLTDITTFPTDSNNSGLDFGAGAVSAVSSDGNLVKATGPGGYKSALSTWLKANAGVTTATDGSTVTDWQDQSLGDHDAVTLETAPTYRDGSASQSEAVNFNPTVDFLDATERGLQIANNSDYNVGGAPYTNKSFNIAIRTGNNITTKQQIYEQGDDTRGIDMYIESGNLVVTAYNTSDDSGSGVSSPWNDGGTLTTISTSLSTETEYIITFELNGSASGTGTVTAYLNGQSFGSFSSVGQLADHSDQIGLGDFNSQTIVSTPASCPVTAITSSSGSPVNTGNLVGSPDGAFTGFNTGGDVVVVDFGQVYPAGTTYSVTWRRRSTVGSGTSIMVIRESTSPASGFVDHPSPPQSSQTTFETDVVTSNVDFRYLLLTKDNSVSGVDFEADAIVVDCTTESITYDAGDAASFYGSIHEFIYCSEPGSFPLSQRQRIESYLAIKYGITLDQSSPINYVNADGDIIFNTTNNASIGGYLEYNNDIAGIGRDDDSELDQPKSRSENTGSVVTIDKGATISTNDTWLIWGNDGAALTETSALTMPDTIDSRLTRVWRVAEENDVQTTSVSFDLTSLGLSADQADFSLLIAGNSTNADFSNATVISGGTLVGNTLTFTGVDLEDGQYFTLGTKYFECSPGGVETNLSLWLKADEGTNTTTDGVEVTSWTDQTGNNNAAATGGTAPTYAADDINFNPSLDFDGTTEFIDGAGGFYTTAYYFVLSPDITYDAVTFGGVAIGFDASSSGSLQNVGGFFIGSAFSSGDVSGQLIGNSSPNYTRIEIDGAKSYSNGVPQLFGVRDNSGGTETNIFNNGEQVDTNTGGSFLAATNEEYELGRFEVPNDFSASNFYNGKIAELISYSVRPTDTEHARIQSYLSIKYGITLDQTSATDYVNSSGSTIWDATTNATYNADIAGIGRDDQSCLIQKQSKSQNSNAIVTMGLGTIETSNAANTGTFDDDGDFLIWGNDGDFADQANANSLDVPGNVTERMERIWKVEDTGNVGATTIQFDVTGLGYGSNLSDFQLITSNSSTMAGGTLTPASSINGNVITFTNVDLADGEFFTLGTARTACGPGGVTGDLYVWLRADAGTSTTTDNTTLSTWSDQSGTGTDAAADGNPPLFKNNTTDNINFNPTMDFDGTDDRLSLGNLSDIKSGATNGGDYTMLGIGIRQDGTEYNFVLGSPGGTSNQSLHFGYRNDNTRATLAHWGNDLNITTANHDNPQAPFLLFGEYDGSGRVVEETRGGAFVRNTDANTTDLQGSNTNYIGDVQSLGNYNGLISEVIVFANDITDLQKQQIYTYLAIKYGITLTDDADNDATTGETISGSVTEGDYVASDGSTIIWDYSANTTYHNDVAGIGRDDDGCFSQKQSTAVDTDDILTVGLGSVATSNGANLNNFDDDKDYFVWGNDNGATAQASANTVDVPTTIAERMTRVWKAQDTGTVGETELQFDLTGLGYTVTDAADFSLLVGNTATMADATIITGGTLNGNVISFSGINLTDGQFFTLATQNTTCGPGGVNTNIAVWFRADLEVFSDAGTTAAVDGANVLQWNDQSSSANNASEDNNGGGSPVEPTFETNEINSNPVIRFSDAQSNNNSWLETASNSTTGAMTLISVFKTAQNNGSATDFTESPALISAEAAGTDDYALGLGEGRLYVNAADNNTYNARSTPTYTDEVVRIGTATREPSAVAGSIELYVNSENIASGTSTSTVLDAASTFAIGNHSVYDADGQFEGDIAETLVFNAVLSETEQARVESYLALKYGITRVVTGLSESAEDYLAADGGVIWDIDNQGTTYHNDIFGIGRDDLSCFEQTQSKSENSDALVTISNGGNFNTDDSFLISGNDNASIEDDTNSEKPAGINSRLNREWRVQETGTVGSVQLTYDLSTITGPLGVGTNNLNLLRLLVDDDGDFSNGGTTFINPTSVDGSANTATFDVDFTSGQYYTLGSTESAALPVTLIAFNASNENNERIVLEWTTVQEVGNAFYSIERSTDGLNFEVIGQLDGAGNSNDLIDYRFTDNSPLNGQAFYRLKQTDFNGEFEYSQVLRVYVEKAAATTIYKVYPNPVESGRDLFIERMSPASGQDGFAYQIISSQGYILATGKSNGSQSKISISSAGLPKGMYLLRIISAGEPRQVVKFVLK
ncbi:MAG: hypothetical protein Roseis2KO_29040 [Roseivirga sp.]